MLSARRVERAAQDARGAAAARGLRLRHHRSAQAAGHDPVARAALRLQARAAAPHRRAPRRRSSTTRRSRYDKAALSLVARESGGSVRDALSLLDQVIAVVGDRGPRPRRRAAEVLGVADRTLLDRARRAVARQGRAARRSALVDAAFARGVRPGAAGAVRSSATCAISWSRARSRIRRRSSTRRRRELEELVKAARGAGRACPSCCSIASPRSPRRWRSRRCRATCSRSGWSS